MRNHIGGVFEPLRKLLLPAPGQHCAAGASPDAGGRRAGSASAPHRMAVTR